MPTCPNCAHTWEEARVALPDTYETFEGLADSVLAFVRANPGTSILSADDPMARMIGFETPDRMHVWRITLSSIKSLRSTRPAGRMDLYRTYLVAAAGRALLAAGWSRGEEPTEEFVQERPNRGERHTPLPRPI